jgi:hypothetical protein
MTVLAQEENNTSTTASSASNTTTTSSSSPSPSGIELSPEPVYQEQISGESQTPINQTHIQATYSGSGTLNLPNTTETIRTTSTGSGILASMEGTFVGKEMLTTEDGSENATATFYEIVRFNMQNGTGKGIIIAVPHTNSTGKLAPLDGMILAGQEEIIQPGSSVITLWEWESGIPYVKMQQPPMIQESTMNATASSELPPSTMNMP